MRILLATDWNRASGGAEIYITLLRDRLRAAGDEVRMLTSSAGSAGDGTADYIAYGTERKAPQSFLQIVNPFAIRAARRARSEFNPDVVIINMFAHHLSPALLNAFRNLPIVLTVSDYKCVCPIGSKLLPNDSLCQARAGSVCRRNSCIGTLHWLRDQPRYALIRAAVRRATRILACSEAVRSELARNGIASEVVTLPVCPPSTEFLREPSTDPLFLFCGRLDREKGVDLLIRAFARLHAGCRQARLRIVGRGPMRPRLEATVTALGLTNAIQFGGWIPSREVESQLRDPWAMVVPSLWAEPLGLVAIEAIVRGLPVIASATGGLAEIVEPDRSGLLFPNNDENALYHCLRAIAAGEKFADHILPIEMVARARQTFNVDHHIARMRRVLTEVIAKGDRNGAHLHPTIDSLGKVALARVEQTKTPSN